MSDPSDPGLTRGHRPSLGGRTPDRRQFTIAIAWPSRKGAAEVPPNSFLPGQSPARVVPMGESSESNPNNKKAQSFFLYGNDAAMKNNYDYAIDMYRSALKLDPGNLVYRQALRGVQRRVYNNEPAKVGRLVGMKTKPMKAGLQASKARGKWIDLLDGCEDV